MRSRHDRIKSFEDSPISLFCDKDFKNYLLEAGFFTAPASTKYHGAYEGGLYDHSENVMEALVELTKRNDLKWQRSESPFIIGMFHDLCKIDSYKRPIIAETLGGDTIPDPTKWEYNKNTFYTGHGDKSVLMLAAHIQLTEEEIACIRYHMGAFTDQSEWSYYTNAVHKYPNVLWTHTADMIAAHIKEVDE